ncbi:type ISP restriction/modification enzyme [Kamptonema formosum]|uniref:type ISP restriction/modification enzyme n=1 Tax=Kamptonema formosum TaxID=331992 RepID=UPI000348E126|nr:type ISP restriction/modification enzyme [Oscillatoria sp. PCC 10802]
MRFEAYIRALQKNLKRGCELLHYPALKALLDEPAVGIEAAIEEKGNKAGIPDLTVRRRDLLVGYIEAKDVGLDLDGAEKTEQLQRYRESLNGNLILTNYLEFRWYVEGKQRRKAVLAQRGGDEIKVSDTAGVAALIQGFLNTTGTPISTPQGLAKQMARRTRTIRLATEEALKAETERGELRQLKREFNEMLLPDLNDSEFADMYAQTVSYGLFAARVGHAQNPRGFAFHRRTAGTYIPATNSFLNRLFNSIADTDSISQINWAVDDLVGLLGLADMGGILENFGRRTRQEDAVVHFYETFLTAYDAALRKSRGVYYTPEPVVSFIVRSVDAILKERFNLPLGLADSSKDAVTLQPRVRILDPAAGTGTFLYRGVNQIYQNLEEMGMAGAWNQYVRDSLLGRLFGFELLMAPCAIAHLKLGLQLQNLGYQFAEKQRLGIYLTCSLDEALKKSEVLFAPFVAQEASEASAIQRDVPVMVVIGNPPYAVSSSNKGECIEALMQRYKEAVRAEKNLQPLSDDYIKFIRFAHHRIEQTGCGIIGFITNHSYLNGLIHRGMREDLLKTFDRLYVMDLRGNSLLQESPPDGRADQNVFDIKQGVAILIAVKDLGERGEPVSRRKENAGKKVFHYDIWGSRQAKYEFLNTSDVNSVAWSELRPSPPNYFFTPKQFQLSEEYSSAWSVADIFPVKSSGIKTHRDAFVIDADRQSLKERIERFADLTISDRQIKERYKLKESASWQVEPARKAVARLNIESLIERVLHRPFDVRYIFFSSSCSDRLRIEVMRHLLKPNLALLTMRGIREERFQHFLVSDLPVNKDALSSKDNCYIFPLYLYPDTENEQGNLFAHRTPNLSPDFLSAIRKKLSATPTSEDIFYYAYAIFHSPTYRQRYAEFLKIDFPRLPLTSNSRLFQALSEKGQELVGLHLMKSKKLNKIITKYPVSGDNAVTSVTYKPVLQRVYIHAQQYFEGIPPEVWAFLVGGYQVLEKWLKDRKKAGRCLSFDDILHYQRVAVALKETLQIMAEIDRLIPSWPLE